MGRDAVRFQCHHCNHCCTEVVCLPTPWDVIRIVRETGQNPHEFLEFLTPDEISGVRKSEPTWLRVGRQKYLMALRRNARGCHFLNPQTRYCSIYEARPILCRLYPFRLIESRDGAFRGFDLHKDVGCPKNRDGIYATAPLYALYVDDRDHQESYQTLVQVFNRKVYVGKKPEDFIEMFLATPENARNAKFTQGIPECL